MFKWQVHHFEYQLIIDDNINAQIDFHVHADKNGGRRELSILGNKF